MDVAESLAAALASWAQFPVHAAERPIVPIGSWLREAGYISSEAKMAFSESRLRVGDGVASTAVASLVAEMGPLISEPGQSLTVQDAVPVRYSFATDRGPRELRAWSLEVTDSIGPVVVVDVDVLGDGVLVVGSEEGWLFPLEQPAANSSVARHSARAGGLAMTIRRPPAPQRSCS
jgi:hypothetical protein